MSRRNFKFLEHEVYDVIYYNVAACDVVMGGTVPTVTRAAAPQYKINHYSTVCCFYAFFNIPKLSISVLTDCIIMSKAHL